MFLRLLLYIVNEKYIHSKVVPTVYLAEMLQKNLKAFQNYKTIYYRYKYIENRIYIRGEFTRKKCKRPFCCTVSIQQVYFTYLCYITCWALEYHFIENLKLLLKENQIMK